MPRTYIRKKVKKYTPHALAEAAEKIKNGELTQYKAALQYNIPLTTLHEHVNASKGTIRRSAGRPTVLPLEIEKKLADAIVIMEKWGFGLSRFEILNLVAEYVKINNIETPFKNNIPGADWFINFRKRHRLSIKRAQPLEFVRRTMIDPFVIAEYFQLLESTLKDLNLFESPQFIWNLDETSLCLDPSRTKVVGQINKPCARTTCGSGKENITVLAGASASGRKLPPLIVFKGKFVRDQWMAELDSSNYDFELSYAASTKGWIETDIFYNYLEKILIPNLDEKRPVLIIYDGHSTHVDVRVVELAVKSQITILKLPPHTSHLLQPLDIAVFKSFKNNWDAKLVDWQRRNVGIKMPKKTFAPTLADTWQQTNSEIIKSGFKKAGIYPFNAQVISVDKYDPDAYKRYLQKSSTLSYTVTNNPKSLNNICIDFFDKHVLKSDMDNVTTLSQLSKRNIQTLRFIAKEPHEIPICLQDSKPNTNSIYANQNSSRINIISNIIIKQASQPPPQPSCTFEELILRKIQQDKKYIISTKKKRVVKGAEVITATMGKKILEDMEKPKNCRKPITKTSVQPGPSGIKHKNKRKRELSPDSITSISDIMSEHSDSDIFDCVDLEDITDFKIYEELTDEKNKIEENILSNKDSNFLSTKSKGIGKRSKGKENQVGKKEEREVKRNLIDRGSIVATENSRVKDKDDLHLIELDSKNKVYTTQEEIYKLNDSVLVRYLIRKKWKYYIGFIEKIMKQEETYSINFLKTVRQNQQLVFLAPKRKDSDDVPISLIVKKISIKKKIDKVKEYYLCNHEDSLYFD